MIDVVGKNKAISDMKTEMDLENSILDDVKKMMEQSKQFWYQGNSINVFFLLISNQNQYLRAYFC